MGEAASSKQFASSDNQLHDTNRVGEQDSRLITEETQPHSRQSQELLLALVGVDVPSLAVVSMPRLVRSPAFCPCTALCSTMLKQIRNGASGWLGLSR
jgi:hypothetical protein